MPRTKKPTDQYHAHLQEVLARQLGCPVYLKRCPGDGECTHDDDRWFESFDYSPRERCNSRGHTRGVEDPTILIALYGRLLGRLPIRHEDGSWEIQRVECFA